jgi:probable F420-dependent oxidoreductase
MRIGLDLPQFGKSPDDLAMVARRAEEEGYATIWVSEHILMPESAARDSVSQSAGLRVADLLEPVVSLAYVAAVTKTIRLATSVLVVPYHNPIHLAKELATLDRLCGGRLIVGVGSGWLESEFRALNAPYEKRGPYTDETIRLMRALWASESPEFKGEFFTVTGMHFAPIPARGTIPIWVGGLSRRAVRRAVELGEGWHGSRLTPDEYAERLKWIREIAAKQGRKLDKFVISHRVYIGFADKWTETGGYVRGILAPPDELAAYLKRFGELGVDELLVTPLGTQGAMEDFLDRFGSQVLPHLA